MDDTPDRPDTRDAEFARDALPFMDDVYRFANSLTRNPADAEDLVQETYLRAYRSWHTFQPGSDARRWLFTICRNAFLRSREKLRHEVEVDDSNAETLAAVQAHTEMRQDGSDQILSRVDLAPALTRALDELAEPFRSTVILVDVEDQSYDAASEVLGVPVGTVRSRLFRGRRQLQEKLREYARDAGFASVAVAKEHDDA
ncbi:MAG: sigma-70 family RNA polymerase sigma factor [Gemmatimonadetes bacterium]|nr:sigma-70 family RNA polymerase sigma factor [Gemmatimonadota bacterium]MBK9980005.1 sigma-70 family RNA polymerase sigma factor [Gemmatimonadota bacterium]